MSVRPKYRPLRPLDEVPYGISPFIDDVREQNMDNAKRSQELRDREVHITDLVNINGVWMSPEDAKNVR